MTYKIDIPKDLLKKTGKSYAQLITAFDSVAKWFPHCYISKEDCGKTIRTYGNENEINPIGMLVAALPDTHSEILEEIADCCIMGMGDCPMCGGVMEYFDKDEEGIITKCNNCGDYGTSPKMCRDENGQWEECT